MSAHYCFDVEIKIEVSFQIRHDVSLLMLHNVNQPNRPNEFNADSWIAEAMDCRAYDSIF
jgi:hypothetical protein